MGLFEPVGGQLTGQEWQDSIKGTESTTNPTFFQTVGNWFGGSLDYQRSLEALQLEQAFARERDEWAFEKQKELMQTSHQMEVEDLKKAGLNPALMSSPGGATAYSVGGHSSPSAPSFHSGKGFDSLISLISGLVSLGVNNARKVNALNESMSLAEKKLDASILQNSAKLNAMQAHWDAQDSIAEKKLSSYDFMNREKTQMYKQYLEDVANYRKSRK